RQLQAHLEDSRPLKEVAAVARIPFRNATLGVVVSAVWPDRPCTKEANRHRPAPRGIGQVQEGDRRHGSTKAADPSYSDAGKPMVSCRGCRTRWCKWSGARRHPG